MSKKSPSWICDACGCEKDCGIKQNLAEVEKIIDSYAGEDQEFERYHLPKLKEEIKKLKDKSPESTAVLKGGSASKDIHSQGANSSGEYDLVSQGSRPKDSIKSETNQFVNHKRCAPDTRNGCLKHWTNEYNPCPLCGADCESCRGKK